MTKSVPSTAFGEADRPTSRSGQVQSVSRALSILTVIAGSERGLTLSQISRELVLAPSTTHRLLTTLQSERYVRFDGTRNLWKVGVQAFISGKEFLSSRDVVSTARPHMEHLVELTGETVSLAVVDEGKAIYLAQVESPQMMRALAKPGAQVFMHCSAVGKALLSRMSRHEVGKVIKRWRLPRYTEHTIDTPTGLRAELKQIRIQGYAVDDEEHSLGLRCVGAAIINEFGEPAAAISASGPKIRIPDEEIVNLGNLVVRTAKDISADFGCAEPHIDKKAPSKGKA